MGLGAPKRRNKLSHDPNNTSWSKSPNNYGQRILSAQGWKPGDYLGAENARHSEHYTAANASHIRILLREENLGLGAQVGRGNAETFGLSLFSGVLGRLNGKSDAEVEKQQGSMRDAELRTYQANKHGFMNFVSGGLLLGDTMKPIEQHESDRMEGQSATINDSAENTKVKKQKIEGVVTKSKKRKASKATDGTAEIKDHLEHEKNKARRPRGRGESLALTTAADNQELQDPQTEDPDLDIPSSSTFLKADSIDTKSGKIHNRSRQQDEMYALETDSTESDKARLKQERRERRVERRKQKDEKRRSKTRRQHAETTKSEQHPDLESSQSEPTKSVSLHANRNAVRRRYIDQKRMASLNPQAMKEIFMLKAPASASVTVP